MKKIFLFICIYSFSSIAMAPINNSLKQNSKDKNLAALVRDIENRPYTSSELHAFSTFGYVEAACIIHHFLKKHTDKDLAWQPTSNTDTDQIATLIKLFNQQYPAFKQKLCIASVQLNKKRYPKESILHRLLNSYIQ